MKLKTLRELVEIHKSISGLFGDRVKINSAGNALTKGELRAIEISRESMIRCLRQEAIGWIKELDKNDQLFSESVPGSWGEDEGDRSNERLQDWIKHFFNITTEDLK